MSAYENTDYAIQFPDFDIPENKKDKEWHKKCAQAITNQSLHNSYDLNYTAINEAYDFYNGIQTNEEFKFLQEAEDGDVLPAKWINYNKIKVKVDLLLGELMEKGYSIRVRATNKEAKSRRLEEKTRLSVEMALKPTGQAFEEEFGLPFSPNEYVPDNEEELNKYFDGFGEKTYKEKSEIVMEAALKWLAKKNDWSYERKALFMDILIAGRCFGKNEIVNGIPRFRRIDPRFMIFDTNAQDDFLSDSSFFGEVRYMNIGDAAEQYNLTKKQIKEVYNSWKETQKLNVGHQQERFEFLLGNTSLKFFKRERGELRVLVISASWADSKKYNHKYSEDKYGNLHVKRVNDTASKDVKENIIKVWRKTTLVGGTIVADWGEEENMVRKYDSLHDTRSPYKCLIPNYINGWGVSKVDQLKGLQQLKDITMYNIQLAMARAGAKGFVYDVSQCPDEWDVHTVIKYLKTAGIAFIDSRKDGIPANFNQFQSFDMTLSASVQQYIAIGQMIDAEMDAISGINEARQGIVQNASQAVGVTQSALLQSNLSTKTLFDEFEQLCGHVLNHEAGHVKLSWKEKDIYSPIIGDEGVDFLIEDVDLDMNDYDVFVESTPKILTDINMFHQLVQAALSSQQIGLIDATKLLMEKDVMVGIRTLERAIEEQEKKQLEAEERQMMMQQQQQQGQAQMQQQQSQADIQKEIAKIKAKGEADLKIKLAEIRGNAINSTINK